MTGLTHRTSLHKWLVVSLLLHSCLLALPVAFLEVLFPTKPEQAPTEARDLTPDFEDMAISIMSVPRESAALAEETSESEEMIADMPPEPPAPSGPVTGSELSGGHGDSDSPADTRFFPAIPRLIVPPALDDLDVSTLTVNLRILVGIDGRPLEVQLPETLEDPEIRKRLLASAGRFKFEPARMGDLPVQAWITLPLRLEASPGR
jgi:protein TonB